MRFCAIRSLHVGATFAALALFSVSSWADSTHLKITFNGSPVGQNSYELKSDGSFHSVTELKLGSLDLGGTVDGHFAAGRITDYTVDEKSQVGPVTMICSKGQIEIQARGKKQTIPFDDKSGFYFGNLHPQFCASGILAAEKALRDNPGSPQAKVDVFMVDGPGLLHIKVKGLPTRKVSVNGSTQNARRFEIDLTTVTVEYALDDANHVIGMDVPAQKLRFVADGWDGLYVDPLAKYPELSQPTSKVKTEIGVKMNTRDGVELVCDVIRPDDGAKHPTILERTPYGRGPESVQGGFWAARGYCYVAQDCRGREDSSGEWDPFVHEGPDGYDTIQWVAAQPWSDGKVGMIGGSYGGYVQWAAAVLQPPALKCIVPQVSPPDAMRNLPYEYGAFAMYADLWWAKIVAEKKTNLAGAMAKLTNFDGLKTLPLNNLDQAVLGQKLPFFQKWLTRETLGDWKGFDYTETIAKSRVPALHISGNWDGDGIGTMLNWESMRKLGRTDQWILFGPWIHAFNTTHAMGDVEYGQDAILELDSVYLRWFDTWLKGKSVGLEKVPHVKLFVTGANKWLETSSWPSSGMPERKLFLAKDALLPAPGPAEKYSYTYDPATDTKIPDALKSGSMEASSTKLTPAQLKTKGAILDQSVPLKKATAITGPFSIKVHFTSSAENTDFYATILDLDPDGSGHVLGMVGKLRAAYLGGTGKKVALKPGKEYVATIYPWQFAHEFPRGHRIGVLITPSLFPIFARNLGTIEPIATATKMVAQHNTILMGKGHESALSFHVIWEK